ncbi:protein phosphatase 2C [Histomonas meleagridis]|uniref:protein phosphatase 2C n=1 Tax=Histomonas meleagridis TaxID=135588 RepID=UPI0035597D20|nr:protein phosphatase 2C [Histomonas meleagridis]KAH0797287.1 protein phosphatase 2C [Histomonas meleagridis]
MDNSQYSISDDLSVGYSSTMGNRIGMEDGVCFKYYDQNDTQLLALFDGHSGNVSSTTASKCLVYEIAKIVDKSNEEFFETFPVTIETVNNILKSLKVADGSTVATAVIRGKNCYVAGIGDSRIIRIKRDTLERITTDNKPLIKSELRRLQDNGFMVNSEGRINRKLAVSRAIGDFWVGDNDLFVKPTIKVFEIDEDDLGLIIACDGLWDVISDQKAAEIFREAQTAVDAATLLKNYAFALQSKDNITVLTVNFKPKEDEKGIVYKNTVEILPPQNVNDEDEELGLPAPPRPVRRRR